MNYNKLTPGHRYYTTAREAPIVTFDSIFEILPDNNGALLFVLYRGRGYLVGASQIIKECSE